MSKLATIIGVIAFFAFGIVQIYIGLAYFHHTFGFGWAIAVSVAAFGFRLSLPLTVGTFLGAMNLWGWPWYLAAVFTAPALAFVVPGAITAALKFLSELRYRR